MKFIKATSAICASVVILAGCSSAPPVKMEEKTTAAATPNVSSQPAPAKPAVTEAQKVASVTLPPYLDPASLLSSKRSVYFDYDNFAIKPEFGAMVEMHGKYLASNPKLSIRVEGNADERGSKEYNLALGQKRAESVVRTLKVYGVKETQMEAISWGEEKPKASGHDEVAFSQNRRVDLGYPTK